MKQIFVKIKEKHFCRVFGDVAENSMRILDKNDDPNYQNKIFSEVLETFLGNAKEIFSAIFGISF